MEELRSLLGSYIPKVEGLLGIVLCDREGVPIIRASGPECPEAATRPSFLSAYTLASDQAAKMGLGGSNVIVAAYKKYQVVHVAFSPLIVTLVAKSSADTGHLCKLADSLEPLVLDISTAVADL